MLTYEIVGIRKYSFSNQQTGQLVAGSTIYCTFEDPDQSDLNGMGTIDFNVSAAKLGTYLPQVGDRLFVSWADKRARRVDSVMPVD